MTAQKKISESPKPSETTSQSQKLTPERFVFRAIEKLAKDGRQTIHTVFSGFNQAFKVYFQDEELNPITEVDKLKETGKIDFHPCRRPRRGKG